MNRGAEARRNRRLKDWLDTFFEVERVLGQFGGEDLLEVTAWIEDIRAINSVGINLERCADLPAPLALKSLGTRSVLCYKETTPTTETAMPTATATVPASRTRKVKTAAVVVTAKMKALAKSFYETNIAANKARTTADKTRKELLADMQNGKVEGFTTTVNIDGNTISLDVAIETPEKMVVDVEALRKLVDEKQFMAIVSASQKAVEDHVGKLVLNRVLVPQTGETNVTVKVAK